MNSEERPLTFDEFTKRDERGKHAFGNFFMHFMDIGMAGPLYRTSSYFRRFQESNDGLETRLTEGITAIAGQAVQTSDALQPHESDLYEAYVVMRSYGVPDETLFT